jgi:hypothetical protein
MTEENQNFTMWAGDTKNIEFTVSDIVSLAGATIKWGLAVDRHSTQLVSKTTTEMTVAGAVFTIHLLPADTASIGFGELYHEAEVTDAVNNVATVALGICTLNPTIL